MRQSGHLWIRRKHGQKLSKRQLRKLPLPRRQLRKLLLPGRQLRRRLLPRRQLRKLLLPRRQLRKPLLQRRQLRKRLLPGRRLRKLLLPKRQLLVTLELQEAPCKPSRHLQSIRGIPRKDEAELLCSQRMLPRPSPTEKQREPQQGSLGRPGELRVEVELLSSYQPHKA